MVFLISEDSRRGYRSTYLPHVAEHFENKEEMMAQLIKKAGYNGDPNNVIQKLKVTRYQSKKVSLPYSEYQKL